jgi:hypothetical protein
MGGRGNRHRGAIHLRQNLRDVACQQFRLPLLAAHVGLRQAGNFEVREVIVPPSPLGKGEFGVVIAVVPPLAAIVA